MALGLIGRKIGMTRVFTPQGESRPVTVVEATPNRVTQVKTPATDGYHGVQVTAGTRRANRVGKAMQGHFAKAGVAPGRGVWEFRLDEAAQTQVAAELTVAMFSQGQKVDVTGRTIGKGFAGVIKRHGFGGGRASHGNSKAHRLAGSIGNAQDPGRIFKGKKMAGRMGGVRRVQQGLEIVRVDADRNLLLISGALPGAKGGDVIICPAVKHPLPSPATSPATSTAPADDVAPKDVKDDAAADAQNDAAQNAKADAPNDAQQDAPQDAQGDAQGDVKDDAPQDARTDDAQQSGDDTETEK